MFDRDGDSASPANAESTRTQPVIPTVRMPNDLPTLVLMPGLDGTGLLFERFASALPPDIQTRIIKYPQHAARLDEYAAVVAEALPTGRVVLLAESFSGIVALDLLRNHQVSVESVIFVASFGSTPHRFLKVLRPLFPVLCVRPHSSRTPPGVSSV